MAFGLKYEAEATCQTGETVRVELWEDGYAGSATSRIIMNAGAIMDTGSPGGRDGYIALVAATCEVRLWDKDGGVASMLASATDVSHKIAIKVAGDVKFAGYVRPDPVEIALHEYPETIVVQGIDGLALLKNTPYLDGSGDFYEGWESIVDTVVQCLGKLALDDVMDANVIFACDWWTPDLSALGATSNPLANLHAQAERTWITDEGDPVSCEAVLLEICKAFNLQIRQSGGSWHVIQRDGLYDGSYRRWVYDYAGVFSITSTFDPKVTWTEDAIKDFRSFNARKSFLPGYQAAQFEWTRGNYQSIVRNPDFSGFEKGLKNQLPPAFTGRGSFPGSGTGGRFRGTGDRSRGGDRKGFTGQGNIGRAPEDNWFYKGAVPVDSDDIIYGTGPEGENAAAIDGYRPSPSGLDPPEATVFLDVVVPNCDYIYQDGLQIVGGTGRKLRFEMTAFVNANNSSVPIGYAYPVFAEVRITPAGGGTAKYMSPFLDGATGETPWTTTQAGLGFGFIITDADGNDLPLGCPTEEWYTAIYVSEEIPDGVWDVRVTLYAPFDYNNLLRDEDSVRWTNVYLNPIVDNILNPGNELWTVYDSDSGNRALYKLESILGAPAFLWDVAGHLTRSGDEIQDNWKRGIYTVEDDTGMGLTELAARVYFRQQREINPIWKSAQFVSTGSGPWADPHQLLDVDGDYFQVYPSYNFLTGVWGGVLVEVKLGDDAPSSQIDIDASGVGGFGGSTAGTGFYVDLKNAFNSYFGTPIAIVNENFEAATKTTLEVKDVESPVERGDKIALITPGGQLEQFSITTNADENATSWDIDNDDLDGTGHAFSVDVLVGSRCYLRDSYILSAFIQTRLAIRLLVEQGALCALDEDLVGVDVGPAEVKTTITVTATTSDADDDDRLVIIDAITAEKTYVRLTTDEASGSTALAIDDPDTPGGTVTITASIGSGIFFADKTMGSRFQVTADAIEALSSLSQASEVVGLIDGNHNLAGNPYTSINLQYLTVDLSIGDHLATYNNSGDIEIFTVAAAESATASPVTIAIDSYNIAAKILGDQPVFVPASELQSGIRITAAQLDLWSSGIQTVEETVEDSLLLGIVDGDHTADTTIQLKGAGANFYLPDENQEVTFLRFVQASLGGNVSNIYKKLVVSTTTLDEEITAGEGNARVSDAQTLLDGDLMMVRVGTRLTQIETNRGEIVINAGNISINASSISTNAGNIGTNASGISANTASISVNTSDIGDNAAAIDLRVTQAEFDERLFGPLVGLLNGSHTTAGRTTINVKTPLLVGGSGTTQSIPEGAVLAVVDVGSGVTGFARLSAAEAAGQVVLSVEDLDGTSLNFPTTMDDDSPVYIYSGHPDIITTGMTIGVGTITFDADLIEVNTGAEIRNAASDWILDSNGLTLAQESSGGSPGSIDFYNGGYQGYIFSNSGNDDLEVISTGGYVTLRSSLFGVRIGTTEVLGTVSGGALAMDAGLDFFGDDITFGDADSVILGDGSDFYLYHDGADNVINCATQTDLEIRHGAEIMARFSADGGVELMYDNAAKIEAISGGMQVHSGYILFDNVSSYSAAGSNQAKLIWSESAKRFKYKDSTGTEYTIATTADLP